MKKYFSLAVAASLWSSVALAQETVTFLHVENSTETREAFKQMIAEFEQDNPDIKIEEKFMDNEAFKSKLATMLHSKDAPDVFYVWGGGNYRELVQSGVLKDITDVHDSLNVFKENISPAALEAFTVDGKVYGAPYQVTEVGFWYNIDLFDQVGLKAEDIQTWDDFLAASEKLKQAGITPIVVSGADKWPLHFYWADLLLKSQGKQELQKYWGENGEGFDNQVFIDASQKYVDFVNKGYFQNGFLTTTQNEGDGYFGDGKAAMILMGDWLESNQRSYAADGVGVTNLGYFKFPYIEGGKGKNDALGGINGWAVSKTAGDEAALWVQYLSGPKGQKILAEVAGLVPAAKGMKEYLANPYKQQISQNIEDAENVQIFLDQDLGSDLGRVVNDVSADLASGHATPEQAAKNLQRAWEFK